MLQIKTIKNRLDNAESFDRDVNAALTKGWTLTKRTVLQPMAQSESMQSYTMLYAELQRVEITEAERGCESCKHYDTHPAAEPCASCEDSPRYGFPTKWEAAE